MYLQSCLLSSFLLVVSCFPAATGQQAPMVNLRQRIIGSEPGLPTVKVTVDRRRVPLGTDVTFTLTPSDVIRSPLYSVTLYFGDGKQQSVGATEVTHLYQAVGTYVYSVRVKSNQRPPRVTLSATPARVDQGAPVSFSAQLSSSYPNIQYRFSYGDGTSSGWQDSPSSKHVYQRAGRYSAYVDIGSGNQQLGGSARKEVDVRDNLPIKVSLAVYPSRAQPRQRLSFVATAFPSDSNTKYRFQFGDSRSTAWQTSSQATHIYADSGDYRAWVEATQPGGGRSATAVSLPTLVSVQSATPSPSPSPKPTPRPSPQPTRNPTPAPTPSPNINSSPSPSPMSSSSPIGTTSPSPDGNTSPGGTPSPNSNGTNENGGNSSPSPGVDTSPASGSASSNGGAGPFGLSRNWWKYLLVVALILFLIYQLTGLLIPQRPTFAAFSDPGVSTLADPVKGLPIDFELVLNRNVSAGAYAVETSEPSLVQNADRLEGRQILEI